MQEIELSPLESRPEGAAPAMTLAMPFLNSVKVTVSVRLGEAEASVGHLLGMKHGEVLALDRAIDQPVDVMVDGHVVARGTLVAVGEHFGVRLTDTPTAVAPAAAKPATRA
ncbi:FliM/FliN family flagellar motor switch protein [Aquabacterium sp. A7-Y]|uniref:FliM/FliN family flagellar motor switch protein n=1 Tax=Aquabacterium sp. A7-Y TaxID=1349605 RepID=UPI00223E1E53|nr:FliM/FliN family flagellar motor switch protein [Aquabacterium sp. A7-Y]MCW7540866.1 FliM/FliN family flagellar motor switch protein [Aquabacterium sp. A7-Y]